MITTLSQFFSMEKLVSGRVVNLLGVQVLRTLIARLIHIIRRRLWRTKHHQEARTLEKAGILEIQNFMPESEFEDLKRRCLELIASTTPDVEKEMHGSNHSEYWSISPDDPTTADLAELISANSLAFELLEDAELRGFSHFDFCAIEKLTQGNANNAGDPESDLHSDTFFSTHKAWLYLSGANERNGYIQYVVGSHRMSIQQLISVYKHSLVQWPRSRRIDDQELAFIERKGMKKKSFVCPQNTFVLSNTCGYHKRTTGTPGESRLAIFFMLRANPFRFASPTEPVRP